MSKLPVWDKILLDSPWPEIAGEIWKIGKKVLWGMANEGVYEVLEYESILEIHNNKGSKATFSKREKICYLQDNIIAYQDYGWGGGEILLNYRTSRGKAVDRYRSGYKTYILLSLQEIKNRGDATEIIYYWGGGVFTSAFSCYNLYLAYRIPECGFFLKRMCNKLPKSSNFLSSLQAAGYYGILPLRD